MEKQEKNDSYLGDGVYVSHDGYQLWIAVDNHENKVVALEPAVFDSLINYAKKHGFLNSPKNTDKVIE